MNTNKDDALVERNRQQNAHCAPDGDITTLEPGSVGFTVYCSTPSSGPVVAGMNRHQKNEDEKVESSD